MRERPQPATSLPPRPLPARVHRGSLLQIPLVRHMLEDPSVVLVPRAIDHGWRWSGLVSSPSATGFRPFYGELPVPAKGLFAKWLRRPERDARPLNPGDALVRDVLFMAHDYLHAWCYGHARTSAAPVTVGYTPITERSLEDLVFVHLVTEACATVGLDYWYLSTIDLNDVCEIGTTVRGMTTSFHEDAMPEYRRFSAGLEVQSPEFFVHLATFYSTGVLEGFGKRALDRSPLVSRWLRHELLYGERQRIYARQWLRHIGGLGPDAEASLRRPVDPRGAWKRELMSSMAHRLFAKVKSGALDPPRRAPVRGRWRAPEDHVDARFTNLNTLDEDAIERAAGECPPQHFAYFAAQLLARHDHAAAGAWRLPMIRLALRERDAPALVAAMHGARRVPRTREPRDVFFVG